MPVALRFVVTAFGLEKLTLEQLIRLQSGGDRADWNAYREALLPFVADARGRTLSSPLAREHINRISAKEFGKVWAQFLEALADYAVPPRERRALRNAVRHDKQPPAWCSVLVAAEQWGMAPWTICPDHKLIWWFRWHAWMEARANRIEQVTAARESRRKE